MAMANYLAQWIDPVPGVSFKLYDNAPTPVVLLANIPAGTFSATIALDDAVIHSVYVTAVGPGGESLASSPVVLAPARPAAPTNLTVVKI